MLLLAYLRGLLKPEYTFGIQSRIREDIILSALAREVEGSVMQSRAILRGSISSFIKPEEQMTWISESMENLDQALGLKMLHSHKSIERMNRSTTRSGDIEAMAKALNLLKSSSLFDRMDELLRE